MEPARIRARRLEGPRKAAECQHATAYCKSDDEISEEESSRLFQMPGKRQARSKDTGLQFYDDDSDLTNYLTRRSQRRRPSSVGSGESSIYSRVSIRFRSSKGRETTVERESVLRFPESTESKARRINNVFEQLKEPVEEVAGNVQNKNMEEKTPDTIEQHTSDSALQRFTMTEPPTMTESPIIIESRMMIESATMTESPKMIESPGRIDSLINTKNSDLAGSDSNLPVKIATESEKKENPGNTLNSLTADQSSKHDPRITLLENKLIRLRWYCVSSTTAARSFTVKQLSDTQVLRTPISN